MGTIHHDCFKAPPTDLTKALKPGQRSKEVQYAVGYHYNGGTIINGDWYPGYEVPPPLLPEGCELKSLHCGLQLIAHPPYATALLVRKEVT